MNTKKFYAVLLLAIIFATNYAQAQFKFGGRTGFNLTRLTEKYNSGTEAPKSKFKPGFQAGIVGEYTVNKTVAIQPSILFAMQGGRYGHSDDGVVRNINYLKIPINALYKLDLGGAKLLLQAGFYHDFAISGKQKCTKKHDMPMHECEREIEFGYNHEDGTIRPVDFGIGLGAGLQFGNIQAGMGYNFGLTNLSTSPKNWNHSLKSDGYVITLTYLFGK